MTPIVEADRRWVRAWAVLHPPAPIVDRPRSVLRRRRARWPLTPEGTAVLLPFGAGFVLAWATGLLGLWPW